VSTSILDLIEIAAMRPTGIATVVTEKYQHQIKCRAHQYQQAGFPQ